MSTGTGIDTLDRSIHNANAWLSDLTDELGEDRRANYRVLRSFLHLLRDRDTFLTRLAEEAQLAGATEASIAAEACAKILRAHVDEGEYQHVLEVLPSGLVSLFE